MSRVTGYLWREAFWFFPPFLFSLILVPLELNVGFPLCLTPPAGPPLPLCSPKLRVLPWPPAATPEAGTRPLSPQSPSRCPAGTRTKGGWAGGAPRGSGVLPGAEWRGRISSPVLAMLILFIHRRATLHLPGVTPVIHGGRVNRPNPQIRSSASVWREMRMRAVRLSIPWADGEAGESGAGSSGLGVPVPRVSDGLFSTGR